MQRLAEEMTDSHGDENGGDGGGHPPHAPPTTTTTTTETKNGGYTNAAFEGDLSRRRVSLKPIAPVDRDITEPDAASIGKFKLSRSEKWRILKNVTFISSAFMIQFTAFQG